jgi:hypothetical protein
VFNFEHATWNFFFGRRMNQLWCHGSRDSPTPGKLLPVEYSHSQDDCMPIYLSENAILAAQIVPLEAHSGKIKYTANGYSLKRQERARSVGCC